MTSLKGARASFAAELFESGPCRASTALRHVDWSPKTAGIHGYAHAGLSGCTTPTTRRNAGAFALARSFGTLLVPVRIANSAAHSLRVSFSYGYTVDVSIGGTQSCPLAQKPTNHTRAQSYCAAGVQSYAWVNISLFDQTNATSLSSLLDYWYGPGNASGVENYTWCYRTGCASANFTYACPDFVQSFRFPGELGLGSCVPASGVAVGNGSLTLTPGDNCLAIAYTYCDVWHNWTLNSSHRYWFIVSFGILTESVSGGYLHGFRAAATFNGATAGNAGFRVTHP